MDIRKVKKLIEMLEASSDVGEIEIREGEESVRISRVSSVSSPTVVAPQIPAAAEVSAVAPEVAAEPDRSEPGEVVESPMVGTFYRSPAPDKPPFVQEGDTVGQGDTVCIIEAMKTMNRIEAPVAGTVSKILADNGEPVEFGQPLMVIQ